MSLTGTVVLILVLIASAAFALLGAAPLARQEAKGVAHRIVVRSSFDLEDYMVSRNQIGGPVALATMTASAMGAWILFSPPEAGSAFGGLTAILGYCLGSAAAALMFVFVGPRLRQIMPWGHSLNEYVRHRFAPVSGRFDRGVVGDGGTLGGAMYWLSVGVMLLSLLSLANIDGLRFGATLLIAIIAAELFNQGNWQRVYACRNDQTVRRSFLGSAPVILPMILLSGLLGLLAAGFEFSGPTAFFDLLISLSLPGWGAIALIVLALALVMSSLDTLLNGISSVFTADLLRISGQGSQAKVLMISRVLTIVVGLPAVAIAAQGYSVLYLFFVADLLCAALMFPLVFSLYSRHQTANNAFVSSAAGIAVGILFFPKPNFSPLFNIPGGGDLLNSFAAALVTSMVITLLWNTASKNNQKSTPFNYLDLKRVKPYTIDDQVISEPSIG